MEANESTEENKYSAQRCRLIACAVLSSVISLALVMNTFLGDRRSQVAANDEIMALQNALRETQHALQQTQHALKQEIDANAKASIMARREAQLWVEFTSPRDKANIFGRGAGVAVSSIDAERGLLNSGIGNQIIYAGDEVNLRPVIHTQDGNAQSLSLTVTGPGNTNLTLTVKTTPLLDGGDLWLFHDHMVNFPEAGSYMIIVRGTVVWPSLTYIITYKLQVDSRPAPIQAITTENPPGMHSH